MHPQFHFLWMMISQSDDTWWHMMIHDDSLFLNEPCLILVLLRGERFIHRFSSLVPCQSPWYWLDLTWLLLMEKPLEIQHLLQKWLLEHLPLENSQQCHFFSTSKSIKHGRTKSLPQFSKMDIYTRKSSIKLGNVQQKNRNIPEEMETAPQPSQPDIGGFRWLQDLAHHWFILVSLGHLGRSLPDVP